MKNRTYLNESVKNGYMLRWSRMPLAVYIASMKFYSKRSESAVYNKLVYKALEAWERASEGLVKFRIVNSLYDSQVNIDWRRVDRKALGHCTYNYNNQQVLYGADVSIGLTDGTIHQQYDSEDEVYHTILHEIGHALGLGHSPYKSDIMYTPHQYGIVSLSRNDAYSIQCLYCLPPATPVRQIAAQYSVMTDSDIDLVISKLDEKYKEEASDGTTEQQIQMPQQKQRDLLDETSGIADIQKYNLMIQSVGLSNNMQKFFIDQHRKSNQ